MLLSMCNTNFYRCRAKLESYLSVVATLCRLDILSEELWGALETNGESISRSWSIFRFHAKWLIKDLSIKCLNLMEKLHLTKYISLTKDGSCFIATQFTIFRFYLSAPDPTIACQYQFMGYFHKILIMTAVCSYVYNVYLGIAVGSSRPVRKFLVAAI